MPGPNLGRRETDNQRNWTSFRVIMEGLILLGIGWLISNNIQQGKDLVEARTNTTYLVRSVDKLPEMERRLTIVEQVSENTKSRVTSLEALERAK